MNVMKKDISIIEWHQLPAPKDRYLLVRFKDEGEIASEVAYSVDGINFIGDTGINFYAPIEAWAYVPYDEPSNINNEKQETLLDENQECVQKAFEKHTLSFGEFCVLLKLGLTTEELVDKDN